MRSNDPAAFADTIDPRWLRAATGLVTVEHLAETDSTMDRARELALAPSADLPALVLADRQTKGRGQRGARWWQAAGSLAMSLVVDAERFGGSRRPLPIWSLACAVALAESIEACEPSVRPQVRWPNDVEVDGRKLAGILVEAAGTGRVIFGVGVNSTGTAAEAPAAVRPRVGTLPDLTGRPLPRQRLLGVFLTTLFDLVADVAGDPAGLLDRYRPRCSLTGHDICIHTSGGQHRGRCLGIAADGRLLLESEGEPTAFVSGSLTDPADVWRGEG